jgi:phosphohistidine phosphatase
MKRRLLMIRHAKSSWANPLQSDFERPLNERGEHDAPMMGERLKKMDLLPDLIISSTAKRARQTAKRIAKAIGYDKERIQLVDKLYHCIPPVFEEVLAEVGDEVQTVYVVAHNPGITEFVNELSPDFRVDNLPTCGIVGAEIELEHWEMLANARKKVFLFEYPKKQQ